MSENNEKDLTFVQTLYREIVALGVWEDDEVRIEDHGVVFTMADIADRDDFNAMGYFYVDIADRPRLMEFAGLRLMLVQRVDRQKKAVLIPKLFELNLNFRNGIFYVDDFGNIFFEAKFPVARDNIQDALASFMAEYLEISDYLDVMYPYLLSLADDPEGTDLKEYMMYLMSQVDGELFT